ncbi:MAG TPA: hypothetical protein VK669_05865 [Candidatus Limnocylindrales bacterium]|nr:hypothetical protein [Candidatus Limnocylindrales bacterium]
MIGPAATLRDVAFTVGTALARAGVDAVLCGGSAATFYAPDVYQSEDLDFVLTFGAEDAVAARRALESLGYTLRNAMFFHDASHFTVEFPVGPLKIGEETVSDVDTVRRGEQSLRIIGATAVVKDRLLKYAAWDDFSSLRAALGVARTIDLDLDDVRAFMSREGAGVFEKRFDEAMRVFERRLREEKFSE